MAGPSEFIKYTLPKILDTVNIIGLVSASIVVLIVILLGIYDRRIINRVTFRIQAGIALLDIIKHIVYLYSYVEDEELCSFIGFLKILIDNIYYFLNVSITINMQLMFLHGLSPSKYWEMAYWVLSFGVGLVITAPFWILGGFGKNSTNICIIKEGTPYNHFITVYLSNGLGLLVLVYCLVVPILVIVKLRWFSESFFKLKKQLKSKDRVAARKFNKILNRLIICSSLYPLSCFFGILGSSILSITKFSFDYATPFLITWALVGRTSSGFLNLVAFLFDPTLHRAIKSMLDDYKVNSSKSAMLKDIDKMRLHNKSNFGSEKGALNTSPTNETLNCDADSVTKTLCGDEEERYLKFI